MDTEYFQNGEPITQMENQYSYCTNLKVRNKYSQNGEQIPQEDNK